MNGFPQGPNGLIVPNGSIKFQLNTDATLIAAPYGFVFGEVPVVFQFNAAGQIQPNTGAAAQIWSNAELNPQNASGLGTYYLVTFYDQNGAVLNATPLWWQFPEAANATVDISNMIPIATVGGNIIFYPTNFSGGGGGTVTSVTFTGDGTILSATPSTAVTTAGTLTATLLTQSANLFLAGPTTGSAANPTFRALVAADIPIPLILNGAAGTNVLNLTNLTAATSLANQSSSTFRISGQFWNGASTATDAWTLQNVLGTGTNPGSALTLVHTGTPGGVSINFGAVDLIAGVIHTPQVAASRDSFFNFNTGGSGGSFPLSSVANAVGNLTTYTGVITPGGGPAAGMYVTIAGFLTGANNGHFIVQSSGLTTVTVYSSAGVAETHAATTTTDLPYYNNAGGYSIGLGLQSVSYSIQGVSWAPNTIFETYGNPVVLTAKGNAIDTEYFRILNNGATGDHGLEIGSIIDGTGATPVTLQLGKFNGAAAVVLNAPLTLFGATPTGTTGQLSFGTTAGIGNGAGTNLTAPAFGTGSGPASLVAVKWLELDIAGTKYWYPLFQ